jgi:hypothetical protein
VGEIKVKSGDPVAEALSSVSEDPISNSQRVLRKNNEKITVIQSNKNHWSLSAGTLLVPVAN